MDFQRKDSAEELLAGWQGELEQVLYSPEVEEAIKEVNPGVIQRNLLIFKMHISLPTNNVILNCIL